jgi:hypothetical protein
MKKTATLATNMTTVPIQVAWRYRRFMPASVRRVPASPGMKYLDSAC